MLVPFLIMLREGIEAALIVGIVASYLKQSGRDGLMPAVWVGVLLASALSLFAGAALQLMAAEFPQKEQELFEGVVGLIAVGMLTSMVFWMRKTARNIKGDLQASVERALGHGTDAAGWALIGMVFLAVAREGLESVFFLLAIFQQSQGWQAPVGALAGTALASVVGERIELLGFVLTSLFVVLAIENWRNHPDIGVLCVGLVAGGIGLAIGGSAALLTALVILAVGLVGLYAWRGRRPGASAPEPGRRDS